MLLALLLAPLLLSARATPPLRTFQDRDPLTGHALECDRCPPGTFLRASCSSAQKTECAPCPRGSFTELWNYIPRCLRCGVCGHNQVEKRACAPDSDCQCECTAGYYRNRELDMCVSHTQCAPGHGVRVRGSAELDTVCEACAGGFFSDVSSAETNCSQHRRCEGAGLQEVLPGAAWHDRVCADCGRVKDAAEYLRDVLPAFFSHHHMNVRRWRRVVRRLPSDSAPPHGADVSNFGLSKVRAYFLSWVAVATPQQIRQLPAVLNKTRARSLGEKLEKKLQHVEAELRRRCHGNEILETAAETDADQIIDHQIIDHQIIDHQIIDQP